MSKLRPTFRDILWEVVTNELTWLAVLILLCIGVMAINAHAEERYQQTFTAVGSSGGGGTNKWTDLTGVPPTISAVSNSTGNIQLTSAGFTGTVTASIVSSSQLSATTATIGTLTSPNKLLAPGITSGSNNIDMNTGGALTVTSGAGNFDVKTAGVVHAGTNTGNNFLRCGTSGCRVGAGIPDSAALASLHVSGTAIHTSWTTLGADITPSTLLDAYGLISATSFRTSGTIRASALTLDNGSSGAQVIGSGSTSEYLRFDTGGTPRVAVNSGGLLISSTLGSNATATAPLDVWGMISATSAGIAGTITATTVSASQLYGGQISGTNFATNTNGTQGTYVVVGPYVTTLGGDNAAQFNIPMLVSTGVALNRMGVASGINGGVAEYGAGAASAGSPWANSFFFNTKNAVTSIKFINNGSQAMVISPSGNVGIGITEPNAKLDVGGLVSASTISVTYDNSRFVSTTTATVATLNVSTVSAGTLTLSPDLAASTTQILYMSGTTVDGANGINYDSVRDWTGFGATPPFNSFQPSATVHISGTARVTGNMYVGGNVTATVPLEVGGIISGTGITTAGTVTATFVTATVVSGTFVNASKVSSTIANTQIINLQNRLAVNAQDTVVDFGSFVISFCTGAFCRVRLSNSGLYVTTSGMVSTSTPSATLHVSGTFMVGGSTPMMQISATAGVTPATCNAATEGSFAWSKTNHYSCVCDGTSWKQTSTIISACVF